MHPYTADLLTTRLARAQSTGRLPSVLAGLVRGGNLVWWAGRGTTVTTSEAAADGAAPDADTQYRIGSITKTFAAVAVLRLRDEGKLDLADQVETHLPGTNLPGATIAQLLAHSAGVPAETAGPWWERTAGGDYPRLAATALPPGAARTPPGRRFHYSNLGFGLLGELLARHRGSPWDDVVRTELLQPLGMSRTTTRPQPPAAQGFAVHPWADLLLPEPEHDHGAMAPAGQLWSTINDLSSWTRFLAGDTGDVLAADTLAEMLEPQAVVEVRDGGWTGAHGLGIQLWNDAGDRTHGHGGSMPGFLALVRTHEVGDGVILLANATTGLDPLLGSDLLRILADHEPVPAPVWHPAPVDANILPLLGIWFWGALPHTLRATGSDLLELAPLGGRGRSSRFRPAGADVWVGLDGYYAAEPLRVRRRPEGSVEHLDLGSFVFTRQPYEPDAGVPSGVDPGGWQAP